MNKINVIFMGNFPYPKGMAITKRKQHFVDFLIKQNVNVGILLLRQGGVINIDKEGTYKGVKFKIIGTKLKGNVLLPINYLIFLYNGFKYLRKNKIITNKNILVLTSCFDLENFVFIFYAKMLRYKIVFDKVEDYKFITDAKSFITKFKLRFSLFWERYILYVASGIITISYYLYNNLKNNKKNVPVILIPVTAEINDQIETSSSSVEIKYLYAGSFGKKDGLKYLIEGFLKLEKEHNNVKLIMCGTGEKDDIEYCKSLTAGCDKIEFTGYVDDEYYYKLTKNADILLMTRENSKYANAGFPFKLGEYLATGKPVIATKISDVEKYLDDKKDAVLVEPENSNSIYEGMKYLLDNEDLRLNLGKNGKKKAKQYFDVNINGRKLYDFFLNL